MMELYVIVRQEERLAGFGDDRQVYALETYRTIRIPDWLVGALPVPLALWLWRKDRTGARPGKVEALPG